MTTAGTEMGRPCLCLSFALFNCRNAGNSVRCPGGGPGTASQCQQLSEVQVEERAAAASAKGTCNKPGATPPSQSHTQRGMQGVEAGCGNCDVPMK